MDNNTEAEVVANIPKEEKSIMGFMTFKQLIIVSIGVGIGFIGFLLLKFILGLFGVGTVTKYAISFVIWIICILPFAWLAFQTIKSDGINPVVLYPLYVQKQIEKDWEYEHGTYIDYHVNHQNLSQGKFVHINNEGTSFDDEDIDE